MTTQIQEYSKTEAALADLSQRYKGVLFDVTTKEGMATAIKGRAELRTYYVDLEKLRVKLKAPALERCRLIDSEAKQLDGAIHALHDPIDDQIKKREREVEEKKQAAIRAEQERIAAEDSAKKEAEEKALSAERERLAKEAAELEARKLAQEKTEREAREKLEADERAARARIEQQERDARLAQEVADRKAREAREEQDRIARLAREAEERKAAEARAAEESRIKAERDALEKAQRAAEEQKRKEREAEEAKQREMQRQENELLDGRSMLDTFIKRFGHRREFSPITAAIKAFVGGK